MRRAPHRASGARTSCSADDSGCAGSTELGAHGAFRSRRAGSSFDRSLGAFRSDAAATSFGRTRAACASKHAARSSGSWRWAVSFAVAVMAVSIVLGGAGCLDPDRSVLATKDNIPPSLVSTDPAAGGIFDKSGFITVTFSEHMNERSLRPGIWLVEGKDRVATRIEVPPPSAQDVPEASQQTDEPFPVHVGGETALKPNTTYLLVLDPVLTDTEGNSLSGPDGGVGQILLTFKSSP